MLKKKPNLKRLEKVLINNRAKYLYKNSEEIITDIINRTQSGKDVNNRRFKGYTKAYKKIKEGKISKPNLTDSSNMLDNIRAKKIRNGIRLYFSSSSERKKAHGNQFKHKRKFFGLDRRQRERIAKKLNKL